MIETYRAFLLPLLEEDRTDPLEINYDAILPSRGPLAKSRSACLDAMQKIRSDLVQWGDRARSSGGNTNGDRGGGVGSGVAGEVKAGGLVEEMKRGILLVAITPSRQEMWSTVGREVG